MYFFLCVFVCLSFCLYIFLHLSAEFSYHLVCLLRAHVFVCPFVFKCFGVCASSSQKSPFPPYPLPRHRASLHLTAPLQLASPVKHTLQAPSHPPIKTSLPELSTNKNTPFLSAPIRQTSCWKIGRKMWELKRKRMRNSQRKGGMRRCHLLLNFSCISLAFAVVLPGDSRCYCCGVFWTSKNVHLSC